MRLRHRATLFICSQAYFDSCVLGKIIVKIGHMRDTHADTSLQEGTTTILAYSMTSVIVVYGKYSSESG